MAAAGAIALFLSGVLFVAIAEVGGVEDGQVLSWIYDQGANWGLSPVWSWAVATSVSTGVGIAIAAPLFRWIGGIGWKCRCRLIHLVVGAALFLALIVSAGAMQLQGFMSSYESIAAMIFLLLTVGFVWHVFAQKRAEARFDADALKAEINTFA